MKRLIWILIFFLPFFSLAQFRNYNFNYVDAKATTIPVASPDSLARALTAPYNKDVEKVRSIFKWITENISYRVRSLYLPAKTSYRIVKENHLDTGALKPVNERVAELVLERRTAVCDGYSRLFKTLCDYAGIKSELISGFSDGGFGRPKFKSNHKWNAVYIDSSWHLLDVTWASGGTSYSGDRFIKNFNDTYFLTPPEEFIRDHYPDDLHWTLMPNPPVINAFNKSPFATSAFYKNYIASYFPAKGIIEASVGDTLHFEVETDALNKVMFIVDSSNVDSAIIAMPVWRAITQQKVEGRKVHCTYTVSTENIEWLNVILNDDVVLRYKIYIRNKTREE